MQPFNTAVWGTGGARHFSRRRMLAVSAASLAAGALARRVNAASYPTTWTFGDVTVTKIVVLTAPTALASILPDAPLNAFTENADWLVPHFWDPAAKTLIFAYNVFLVTTPRHVVLVDCGYGNDKVRPGSPGNMLHGPFLEDLRAAGATPDKVNFVMNTHFHTDHIGWNTRLVDGSWVPTFPKARYLFQRAELAASLPGPGSTQGASPPVLDSVKPIVDAKLVDVIDGDHEIGDGLRIVFTPGHTPGHHCLTINSRGKRAIFIGDILHTPAQIRHPEWTNVFDSDKAAAQAQRIKLIDTHTDVDVTVFAAHFGGPTAGKIVSENGSKRKFRLLAS